jgi:26S proteasome regulatory subunit T6
MSVDVNMKSDEGNGGGGLRSYYQTKIDQLALTLTNKQMDLRRLEAQRNDLNSKGLHTHFLILIVCCS